MRVFYLAAAVLTVGACGSPATVANDDAGSISISWGGQYFGRLNAPATASWCPVDSMLQVLAVREDTAFGLALFVTDTLRPTQHPVLSPQVKVDWRPLASAALRWLSETEVVGFEGITGVVSITDVDSSGISGTFDIGFRVPAGSDTVKATGSFRHLEVVPAVGSCGRANKAKGG